MKGTGNSRINREEQVKVVIRLKPDDPQARLPKCLYLSDKENQLVVQTQNKKQVFAFDHIAHQYSLQMDIYRMIGQEVVQMSFEGYNCCIFAYGQTGAGKTYSVMGNLVDINSDYYSEHRGLLPRIIEDVFAETSNASSKRTIACSFMEVYNQQIFDLLSPEKRIHQIRQDFKRGVFVEGLTQRKITSYKQTIELLLQGEKTRKIASTAMNNQSSRSHAIFTILIETEVMEGDILKLRKSKLNIVDLAGSERVKHTNVMGEQLKEGCNINKSLHVLGNVINSLVESAKKKKHIPFRDSKLTHYLKDSLGGNSITKLLANIHTSKMYLGDTLSTLMFAKRAKSLKLKAEINQNVTQNFDSLRKEVKRLRQQLAQAKYFKGDTQRTQRPSFQQDTQITFERITENKIEVQPKSQILTIFEQNQLHYKSLMEIYEQHIANCTTFHPNSKFKQPLNMVTQWKNLQKKNTALLNLVKQFPAFTKIYKENLLLKEQDKIENIVYPTRSDQRYKVGHALTQPQSIVQSQPLANEEIVDIIDHYQKIIDEMQSKFGSWITSLEKNYVQLEHECKIKDKRLKQFIKKQNNPPQIQQLQNQNEYLHLNILNLQNQIQQYQQATQTNNRRRNHSLSSPFHQRQQYQDNYVLDCLQKIKEQAQRQMQIVQKEREEAENIIQQLKKTINKLTVENTRLQMKSSRSRSSKKGKQIFQNGQFSTSHLSLSSLYLEESQIIDKKAQARQQQIKNIKTAHLQQINQILLRLQEKQSQITQLKQQLCQIQKIEEEFGKSLSLIINEQRQSSQKLINTKSMINIYDYKQPQTNKIQVKQPKTTIKTIQTIKHSKLKEVSKLKKEETIVPLKSYGKKVIPPQLK